MVNKFRSSLTRKFDYKEDEYDRLNEIENQQKKGNYFTNKATFKKVEFDYEEDPYEPDVDLDEMDCT